MIDQIDEDTLEHMTRKALVKMVKSLKARNVKLEQELDSKHQIYVNLHREHMGAMEKIETMGAVMRDDKIGN